MTGFFLLLGHLLGDYVFQEDWQAKNKTNPSPGPRPVVPVRDPEAPLEAFSAAVDAYGAACTTWHDHESAWFLGHIACTVHCLLYTLAVWACSFWWMPWWGLVACFAVHWPVDRFRLAYWWMTKVNKQKAFATGPLAPWSIIVVDQCFHLATLGVIYLLACGLPCDIPR